MINDKIKSLRPILESSDGIHLTAYLSNQQDPGDLPFQLRKTIEEAERHLAKALPAGEREKFLEPLRSLLEDPRVLDAMKANVGLFRTKNSFRMLNVPVDVESRCYVADTFHVKPLLRWMQFDREFLFVGVNADAAHIYRGQQTSYRKIGSLPLPPSPDGHHGTLPLWLNDCLEQLTKSTGPRLFLAGDKLLVSRLVRELKYGNVFRAPVALAFDEQNIADALLLVRTIQKAEARKTLELAFRELRSAEKAKLARKSIFQIAKSAVQGRIRKLIIADDVKIFGKVDMKTGGLAIHPYDLDHEDDDILDDLAQTVLSYGGEVVVAPKNEFPDGRVALAIVRRRDGEPEESEVGA